MIYFSSDLHLQHAKIIEYCNRPFKDTQEMDEMIIHNWNNKVQQGDIVFVNGDFCMGKRDKIPNFLSRLNGKIYLVPGNHDNKKTLHYFPNVLSEQVLLQFPLIAEFKVAQTPFGDIEFLDTVGETLTIGLTHIPHNHQIFFGEDKKYPPQLILCGHVHDSWKFLEKEKDVPDYEVERDSGVRLHGTEHKTYCPIYNVGVDVNDFEPKSINEILEFCGFQKLDSDRIENFVLSEVI